MRKRNVTVIFLFLQLLKREADLFTVSNGKKGHGVTYVKQLQ